MRQSPFGPGDSGPSFLEITLATPAEIQAELDPTMLAAKIERVVHADATYDNQYITGGIGYASRGRWTTTTASDSAATQAAAIETQLGTP